MENREWNPGKILEIAGRYWETCALHAAVKLDIFTIIGDSRVTAGTIAEKAGTDIDAVSRLLDVLTATGFLVKADDMYENTEGAQAFLSRNAPGYIGYIIMHHHHLMESWSKLDKAVKAGKPVCQRKSFSDEEWRENFLMGMYNMASNLAPKIASSLDLTGCRHLLDLGAGPGTYAIHFCLFNPNLKATVYDFATTRPFAEKLIANFGLSHRIDFHEGNYLEENIDGQYDAAWLSHVLHSESPSECREIIKKTVSALTSKGLIIVHDFLLNDAKDGPLFPALFSLNMLLNTNGGRAYSEKEIFGMLQEAGVEKIQRIPVRTPHDSGIIMGSVS